MARDPRIDAYIASAAPFARPILEHLRELVHTALPGAQETIKWSMPHFTLNGKNIAGMAAFKAHAAFVIHGEGRQGGGEDGMGAYGKIHSLAELPADAELASRLHSVRDRLAAPVPKPVKPRPAKAEIPMPDDFAAALAAMPAAKAHYENFAPSHRRDYLEWITEAKQPATRARRIEQAVAWLAEGKRRNWKYESC